MKKWKWWYIFFAPLMIICVPFIVVYGICTFIMGLGVGVFCWAFNVECPEWAKLYNYNDGGL